MWLCKLQPTIIMACYGVQKNNGRVGKPWMHEALHCTFNILQRAACCEGIISAREYYGWRARMRARWTQFHACCGGVHQLPVLLILLELNVWNCAVMYIVLQVGMPKHAPLREFVPNSAQCDSLNNYVSVCLKLLYPKRVIFYFHAPAPHHMPSVDSFRFCLPKRWTQFHAPCCGGVH